MAASVTRLRRWFAACAIVMVAIVAGMYFYAQWRLSKVVHQVPAKLGLDIQQTAEGFSISKSEQGHTIFTVSANKAVQFKQGSRAELHNVKITIYGKDSSRFDRISGDDFEFDPKSGDVTSRGKVLIDLETNPEGTKSSDQTPPSQVRDPIHLETEGLVFNKNSGNASASGRVSFATPQSTGSAVGVNYVSKTGTMTLRSAVEVAIHGARELHLTAARGEITKTPAQVVLDGVHLRRDGEQLQSERATFFLRPDNTVERIFADGNVQAEVRGRSDVRASSDAADLQLTGTRNQLTSAVLEGKVHLETHGEQPAQGDAGRVTLHFGADQVLEKVHAEHGVRLAQERATNQTPTSTGSDDSKKSSAASGSTALTANPQQLAQQIEMTAPAMDFTVKNGRQLQLAETTGPPQIVITQPATKQKTIVTAAKFTTTFATKNRIEALHGAPDAKIVSTTAGQPDRVSSSPVLDVAFLPEGGISTITQSGGLTYVSGTQKAWAQRGVYTSQDELLTLTGSPRVADGTPANGVMTTTAQTIRFNRTTGDAVAEGDVRTTYSDLKPQPDGGMLSSSDPIHVVSRTMTAHRSPAVAVYTGNARLWQNSSVVEAPTLQFDRDHRSLIAEGTTNSPVKTVLVQAEKTQAEKTQAGKPQPDKPAKATPVTITSAHMTYNDAERKIYFEGGVNTSGSDAHGSELRMTARHMTVYLVARNQTPTGKPAPNPAPASAQKSEIDKIVAEENVVIVQPTRRATGDKLVYTAADDRFDLTGGPPSIFDAEQGKITGDSLTFYRHDDRVLVEGRQTSPAVTRTQVAR